MGNFIDLSGQRFGHWTVIERDNEVKKKNIYWKCKCDCGTVRSVAGTSLRSGISVSCGCDKDRKTSIRTKTNVEDLLGQRFGRWTVIEQDLSDDNKSKRGARWICRCDCGNEVSVLSSRLRTGQTSSCGCLRYENKKYNKSDLTGQKFGKWSVLKKDESQKGKGTHYVCQCECGTIRSISPYTLIKGFSKSCGCGKHVPKNDLTGRKFGKLTVIGVDEEKRGRGIQWICKCECGNLKSYRTNLLIRGNVISCGCETRKMSSERNFIDISNNRFGRLVALQIDHKEADSLGNTDYYWKCQCDCGNTIVVQGTVLRRGDTKSCGCLQSEESAKRAKERTIDLVGKRFGLLTVIERVSLSGESSIATWKCKCDCGNEKLADGYYLKKGMIVSCGCLKQSKYEMFVLQYFEEKGYESPFDFEYQKRFDDLRGYSDGMLSYDFSVNKDGKIYALIECQGQQHYKPVEMFGGEEQFAKQQLHDEIKRDYAKKLNVPLIEIPYTVINYEEVKEILIERGIKM